MGTDRAGNGRNLDQLCAITGWRRNHVRNALKDTLRPKVVTKKTAAAAKEWAEVLAVLTFAGNCRACWRQTTAALCWAG